MTVVHLFAAKRAAAERSARIAEVRKRIASYTAQIARLRGASLGEVAEALELEAAAWRDLAGPSR